MKDVKYFQAKFATEVKGEGDKKVITIKGFASTGDVDRVRDRVLPTAFTETLPMFLKNPVMLLQHDDNKVIGQFTDGTIKNNGLEVTGDVMYDIDECMKKIEDGVLGAFSIGFITQAYQYEDEQGHILYKSDEGLQAGYEWDDLYSDTVVRTITKVDLVEVSIVATPCNPYALFQVAKDFFAEETKKLKTLATQKKGAPNEFDEPAQEEIKPIVEEAPAVETTAIVEDVPAVDTPAVETPADEPAVETPSETATEEIKTEVVKADEEPEETPVQGVTEDEVKALIDSAVQKAIDEVTTALESKFANIASENAKLRESQSMQEAKYAKLEKEFLNIETVRPGSQATRKSAIPVITDEMVLKSIGL